MPASLPPRSIPMFAVRAPRVAAVAARTAGIAARVAAVAAMAALAAGVALLAVTAVRPAHAQSLPTTNITVNASTSSSTLSNRVYDGVGGVLAGGANARYIMDYPGPERSQLMDYLFKPDYGASLQMLKLEVGAGANSTDGSEPSIEPVKGQINCNAGFEMSIAQQAVARNPNIVLYGLQWAAPSWVNDGSNSIFTSNDIQYLLDWLGCAKQRGLTISYLGGWNEDDNGNNAQWFYNLRQALNANGYSSVHIIAGDTFSSSASQAWQYTGTTGNDAAVDTLGAHDMCGYPTGTDGADTTCVSSTAAQDSGKPLWASELGGNSSGAGPGCNTPCAPAMTRSIVRGYIDAKMTGYLEWPALDAMPAGLPYEDAGLVTADQPWSGNYSVNAQTWAIAHFTQFVSPGWHYIDSASGYLQDNRTDGGYDTLVSADGGDWSSIIETTAGVTSAQQANFTITGGASGLSGKTVHVWASNFSSGNPSNWFVQQPDITPSNGTFSLTIQPGYVYSLTTTSGQSKGSAAGPQATSLPLPYSDNLSSSGPAGSYDNEPELLASQDGQFELAPCQVADGGNTTCTQQNAKPVPVVWRYCDGSTNASAGTACRYPYATAGDGGWADYTVSSDVLFTQPGTTAGLISRFSNRAYWEIGWFDGYLFDVSSTGAWKLIKDSSGSGPSTLASGTLSTAPGTGTWHHLSLSMASATLTASVDGQRVTALDDTSYTTGQAGLEAGAFAGAWPQVQYSNLSVTPNPGPVASGMLGKCLDDRGDSAANGTAAEIWDCNGSSAQGWALQSDGTVRVNGKCLDVIGQGTANGTKVDLWDCNGGGNQQWQQNGNHLVNPASGRCLDDPGYSTTNGTQLDIWECVSQSNEAWYPPPAAAATGAVTSGISGKCLDDQYGSAANGAIAEIWTCDSTAAQQWTPETDGTIRSASGACLDVIGQGTANGTKVDLWGCNGGANQQWRAGPNHTLFNPLSGRCLDDPGYSTTDGTQLDIWDCVSQSNEAWYPPTG